MKLFVAQTAVVGALLMGTTANAGMTAKNIVVEVDPISPATAAVEQSDENVSSNKWGGTVDFNIAANFSTGPEFWTGTYSAQGATSADAAYRRQDLWPGEREKISAMRLRWNITKWEQGESMRGWYIKAAYSYTRIDARANRYESSLGLGESLPVIESSDVNEQADLVTDVRHGVVMGAGNRWQILSQKLSITIGASMTANVKRVVAVDGGNETARADYDALIETLPDTRIATRLTPEVNLGLGWVW